jgi:hypothetical protein
MPVSGVGRLLHRLVISCLKGRSRPMVFIPPECPVHSFVWCTALN